MCEDFEGYPDILTMHDVREMLEIGRNSAYNLFHEKEFPGKKIGGKWCVTKGAFRRYLDSSDDLPTKVSDTLAMRRDSSF